MRTERARTKFAPLNAVEAALFERRAIRRYTDRVVDRDAIEHLLNVAVRAPSSMDAQPWSFAVYQGKERLEGLAAAAAVEIARSLVHGGPHPLARAYLAAEGRQLFHGASTLIVICSTTGDEHRARDCYLAADHLMLAAHALGLGTCPIGAALPWLALPETRTQLSLGDAIPVFPLVVGYPAEHPAPTSRRAPEIIAWR
jgi:nitroreductase